MKMICEVPDEVIKCVKDGMWCGSHVLEKMIANGIPLSSSENPNKSEIMTGWIPVSERLPEDKHAVLVYCPEYKNTYCAYHENNQWWIFGAFVQLVPNAVVAWMPLPEPYKAESEKKE